MKQPPLTPDQRSNQITMLSKMGYAELCAWLCEHFTPERYRASNDDVIEAACSMLFVDSNRDRTLITDFLNKLWARHGELPDMLPNVDQYGRLTSWRPNYAKPGMRERVYAQAEAVEPSRREKIMREYSRNNGKSWQEW